MRIEEEAREILRQLGHLQGDLDRFREDFRLVGRHLGNATAAWSTADKRMEKLAERFVTIEGLPGEISPAVWLVRRPPRAAGPRSGILGTAEIQAGCALLVGERQSGLGIDRKARRELRDEVLEPHRPLSRLLVKRH